jgi:organic hydroperoxide reductase OsmC/OhrA
MFLSALSTCHMLWYLHLCADAGVVVTSYTDKATGVLTINPTGISKFTEIVLFPTVKVQTADMIDKAISLHHQANKKCFIANSCNVIVKHQPTITI